MRNSRHFRLFDIKRKKYVLNFYVHKGSSIQESANQAMTEFDVNLRGPYRIDRMVWVDGNAFWIQGSVIVL